MSIGTLQKAPLEDVATGGQINTRLVSARYQNPTTFPYYINSATVIKTATLDPNNELEKWTFTKENGQLMPGETWKIDVYDRNAFEGEIYWLSSDMYIRDIFYNESSNFSFFTQDDLFKLEDNSTNVTEELITSLSYLSDRVFLTKRISSKVVNPGDVVTVTLLANNFATAAITGVAVEDTIPEGFEFVDSRFGTADDRKISWTNVTLNSKETRRIEYKIRYTDEDAVGIDYFSAAKLMYGNKEVYSQAIPYIRSYIPKKQLFVQKSINFISDDEVRVDITLQNVGESHIDSIVLNDYLAPNSEFREITQTFTNKGVWKIDRIEKDSTWEVSYVTDSVGVLNTFPVVFGIEDKSVLKTVILSNIISTNLQISTVRFVEIGGIIALLIIGVLFSFPTIHSTSQNEEK